MNRSFQSVVIAFFASILLISGCSSGSSTGVSFSKEAVTEEQCFSEYVSFYGDLQDHFLDDQNQAYQALFDSLDFSFGDLYSSYDYDIWSSGNYRSDISRFGKDHYHRTGAKEGRQLPYGCERFLRPHPQCFRDHYFSDPSGFDPSVTQDDFDATNEMAKIHGVVDEFDTFAAIGFKHWINHGRVEGRAIPTNTDQSCKGMITHQPACRPGSRFPNCDDSQDLGATGLADALAAAVEARAAACAATGGTINNDTGVCTPAAVICTDGWDEDGNAC